jgi:hypothetical protein
MMIGEYVLYFVGNENSLLENIIFVGNNAQMSSKLDFFSFEVRFN